jgi:hypothetical protein
MLSTIFLYVLINYRKHGTFRPSLAKLVASNSPDEVKTATQNAFSGENESKYPRDSLNHLTKLKGVGPATASLVLSCYDPQKVPFASDELFRWLHWDGKNSSGKTDGIKQVGKGWSRQIGYTQKEYTEMCARNARVRQRLEQEGKVVSSLEMEKVAYVLGKEKVDLDEEDEPSKLDDRKVSLATKEIPNEVKASKLKPESKRAAEPADIEAPKRSKRVKKS